ncbi:MAG TPA: tetratricopeptide repeat protein [Vicinamibacterales bacterium]
MGFIGLFYPWGLVLQALAILHFARRRPDNFWLWIIIIGGGLGALVYIVAEVVPDAALLRSSLTGLSRRRRMRELETIVLDNPSVGNLEELADLYLDEGKFARARELYDKVISPRSDSLHAIYRRGLAASALEDFPAAVTDLERVVARDPKYDFHRAIGVLAHSLGKTGQPERAEQLFKAATDISTLSETYYNYASFLAAQQRTAEAREWAQKILAKKPTMPGYLRRRERPWFRKARALLKQLPA